MKHIRFLVVALLAFGMASAATAGSVNFNGVNHEGFELLRQDFSGVEIAHGIQQLSIEDIQVNGQTMKALSIPGVVLPNDEGAPNLPGNGKMIAVPEGATATYRIVSSKVEVIENIDIAPAPVIPFENDDSPPAFIPDPQIYGTNAYYPDSPVKISDPQQLRGVDFVMLGITPFQYNPVTKELRVYTELRVEVTFHGGSGQFGEERLRSRYWEPVLQQNLVNYQTLPYVDFNKAPETFTDDENFEYVIIVPDDPAFIAWADTIRDWRTLQGIRTGVFTLSEIGGNNASTIENWVNNAYNNWDIPPSAVLLLSDYQNSGLAYGITSPMWNGYCVSDNIYADVDGDDLPEMAFARITAQNDAHLSTMVNKFLDYERNPPTNPDFYNHPITAGGWQTERWFILCTEICWGFMHNVLGKDPVREYAIYYGTPGSQWSTNQNTQLLVDYFGPNGLGYIPATPGHLNDWGANATRINNDLNSGAFMLLHRDHGSVDGWGEPDYDIGDLSGLHNEDLCFVLSINCLTGEYDYGSQCFAEAFHRMTYGALGVIAASEVSYSFVNDTYIFGLMDHLWPDFDPGHGDPGDPTLNPCFANASAKHYLQASSWPYNPQHKVYTHHLFHHHGDAFITLYSEMPQDLTVSHAPVLFSGFNYFTVTADAGSYIGLTVGGEIIGTGMGTGGPVDIPIIPQNPGGTLTITVTKPNFYRYEESIDIIPPSGYGVIEGYVRDLVTNDGLQGLVTVINRDPQINAYCEENGHYLMYVPMDTVWNLRAEYTDDYLPSFADVSVSEDDTVQQDFYLEPKVEVIIRASFGNPAVAAYRSFYFRGSWDDDGFYDPNWPGGFNEMRDDGVYPDEVAVDGIFTGSVLLATDPNNTYDWALYTENYNGEDSRLQDGASFDITDPGNPPDVPVLDTNPSGGEHNWIFSCEEIHGFEFDLAPGFCDDPGIWGATGYLEAGVTVQYRVKPMRSNDVWYGEGGVGGDWVSFTPPETGTYTVYFDDNADLLTSGANLVITPSWLDVSQTPGNATTRELTFTNNGVIDLEFLIPDDFQLSDNTANGSNPELPDVGPRTSYEYNGPKPTVTDPPQGPPVTLGQGGPDNYGYKWVDSNEPGGPSYSWVDITSVGTPLNMSDDDNEGPFALPFNFNFYGTDFNSFRVCSNGWVSFTSTSTSYYNYPIPGDGPENMLAAMWDDFNPSQGGEVYYYVSNDSAVVSWVDVPHYYNTGNYSFQIVMLRGGLVFFNYQNLNGDVNSATVGIQNSDLSDGLQVVYNQAYLENNLTIKFAAGWLEVEPLTGIIPAGGSITVNATFDASVAELGDHTGLITVNSWDAIHALPDIEIPVDFHVVSSLPDLDLAMHPAETPVEVIPGGSFDYGISVHNNTGSYMPFDGWLMLTLPGGDPFGPLANIPAGIDAGQTIFFEATQWIPVFAPIGTYNYESYVGNYPGTVIDMAEFPFDVISSSQPGDNKTWNVDGFLTGGEVAREGDENLPAQYSLSQNYPNPFNAKSIINYALPKAGKVQLNVYNLLGQKVETLIDGYQQAGYHSINWDASHYSSGIYFYKLSAGEFSKTKQMTLIK